MGKEIIFKDAQEMKKKHRKTFEAPTQEQLDKIKIDDFVKVCVEEKNSMQGERFWVIVQKIEGENITGIINNDLVLTHQHGLKCDDVITFEKKNIYSTL